MCAFQLVAKFKGQKIKQIIVRNFVKAWIYSRRSGNSFSKFDVKYHIIFAWFKIKRPSLIQTQLIIEQNVDDFYRRFRNLQKRINF